MSLRSGSSRIQSALPAGRAQKMSLLGRPESAKQLAAAKENTNTKNTGMVTMDDLLRIKKLCAVGEDEEQLAKAKAKEELQQKSKARVEKWPNTIDALRQKRQEEKLQKLREEEVA